MDDQQVRVGIIGATGYSGMELIRLLLAHPNFSLTYLAGTHARETQLAELFPHLLPATGPAIAAFTPDACAAACDLAFVALPSGQSGEVASHLFERGLRVIDLSGDLRLPADTYRHWYKKEPVAAKVQSAAVYGLTEFNRVAIQDANLIANPGCYATAALLGLKPLETASWVRDDGPIVIDAKSGVTGAGRGALSHLQFAELADDFYPYRVGTHQHLPEIEQAVNGRFSVMLTTQLLPVQRGIFASLYIPVQSDIGKTDIYDHYVNCYQNEAFVHILPEGQQPHLKAVRGSNHGQIGLYLDETKHVLQVFCAIDNLQKGAAGQALQNANVMFGFPEATGLSWTSTWM